MSQLYISSDKKMSQLPGWLWPNSNALSPLYKRIWEVVQEDCYRFGITHGEVLVDTNKIFPLLLTSQLPTEVLGYIWSLANQKYAGQLTEQELYIVLALVALAQASYPFNSLEVLYYIHIPPTPNLNLALLDTNIGKIEMKVHVSPFESSSSSSFVTNKKHGNITKPINKSNDLSSSNEILSYNHNYYDNLRDNKLSSGYPSLYNSNTLCDIQYNFYSQSDIKNQSCYFIDSNDDFSDFQSAPVPNTPSFPNIWDSKQGSAIGSRLANHNLGIKKLNDKMKKTGISKSSNNSQMRSTITSNSMSHSREIQSNECLSELFPKCTVKNQAKTVILKDTAIRNNDPVVDIKSNTDRIIINKINQSQKFPYPKNINSFYVIPQKKLKDDNVQKDLMSLQPTEDKYSALRALVNEPSYLLSSKLNVEPNIYLDEDDFGEFISAEHLKSEPLIDSSNVTNSIDLLSDLDFNPESIIGINTNSSPSLIQEISDTFNSFACEEIVDQQIEKKFDVLLNTEKFVQKEDALLVNSIELDSAASEILIRSGSIPSLDLKLFLPSSEENEQQIENINQMIYWEWKHYMESCVLLIQVAVNIFTSITSETVLKEVLLSAQGYNFLCNLAEVAAVCRRVNFSHKEMDINIMGFDDLLIEIDRIWSEMEPYYSNIPIVTELPIWPLYQGDRITCALCLTVITNRKVIFNDYHYHATCANLWLHIVNNNLPVLEYPVSYIQSISQRGNHT